MCIDIHHYLIAHPLHTNHTETAALSSTQSDDDIKTWYIDHTWWYWGHYYFKDHSSTDQHPQNIKKIHYFDFETKLALYIS